jgi:prokaryotic ubiquitin-like protein Pup
MTTPGPGDRDDSAEQGPEVTEQSQRKARRADDREVEDLAPPDAAHKAELDSEVDSLLDELDDVLEVNAEEFVRSYVEKGAQGVTDYLTPEFFEHVVAEAIAAHVVYDAVLKPALLTTIRALRKYLKGYYSDNRGPRKFPLPEGSIWDITNEDGSFKYPEDEQLLKDLYDSFSKIPLPPRPQHDQQEADAAHAIIFFKQLMERSHWVELDPEHHRVLQEAGRRKPGAKLTPSQVASDIIGAWIQKNPNASIGRFTL